MSPRTRVAIFVAAVLAICSVTAAYLVVEVRDRDAPEAGRSDPQTAPRTATAGGTVFFRNTTVDERFGQVQYVGPDDRRTRRGTGRRCDRVDVAPDGTMVCLSGVSSILARTRVTVLAPASGRARSWTLPGVPSRTRLSPDGTRLATTVFVTGHSYTSARFATSTEISDVSGRRRTNLERFRLVLDGRTVRPVDRNFWGVTFLADGDGFYATAGTDGRTWLVRGSVRGRLMRSVRSDVECPSVSPDGTRVAYKKRDVRPGATWSLAVLDLATGQETLLGERHSVDDQVEWLDDERILYALPRDGQPGTSDVWALEAGASAEPRVLVRDAGSPAVAGPGRDFG